MASRFGIRGGAAVAAIALLATAARAEVVEITGEFPAQYREVSFLESIAVDRIVGQDGYALQVAIERALAQPGPDGRTPFDLLGGRTGRAISAGSLSGAVSTGVQETPFRKKEKKCAEKGNDGKCAREEEVETQCRRRVVDVNADLRIVRNSDGRILYSVAKPVHDEISWCEGENPGRTVEDTVAGAIRNIAGEVRGEIAPHVDTYRIRVRESSKGMPKDAAKQFKGIVKQSQRDLRGACAGWQAMNVANPGHPSILFDLGLCAEQRGDYAGALALYRDAQGGGASEGAEGANRASQLIAGRQDAAERARIRGRR